MSIKYRNKCRLFGRKNNWNNNNSFVFIMFNTVGMNINFRLNKFNPLKNEEIDDKYYYEIYKKGKAEINN